MYPMRQHRPQDNDLQLPTHWSKVGYRTQAKLDSVHARVWASLAVDSNSRTANKLRRKRMEDRRECRAQSRPFRFEGEAKQLIVFFTGIVKTKEGEPLLQFNGDGIERSLYYKVGGDSCQQNVGNRDSLSDDSQSPPVVDQADGMVSIHWKR